MIRPATPYDASPIAKLIILAMGDTLAGKFANSDDPTVFTALFERFAGLPANPYSYENILVWVNKDLVCGMIMAYDGGRLKELRLPFLNYTRSKLGFIGTPEDETQAGEFYIDCLAVFPQFQGGGIAKELINAASARAAELNHDVVGLLVSKDNDKAKKLYTKLGFKVVGEKALLGGKHYHLQYRLPS